MPIDPTLPYDDNNIFAKILRGELPAGARRHADDQRHAELAARHMTQGRGIVDDLVEREQREIDRHDLDDGPHAAHRRADARTCKA